MGKMEVCVEKPTPEKLRELNVETWGIWECEPKTFDWFYHSSEIFYVLEGLAKVKTPQGEVEFGKGDLVTFPAGMKCVWTVVKPIRKHYLMG